MWNILKNNMLTDLCATETAFCTTFQNQLACMILS